MRNGTRSCMRCAYCEQDSTERHHFRFTSEQIQVTTKEIEFELCRNYLSEFLTDSSVEMIRSWIPPSARAAATATVVV